MNEELEQRIDDWLSAKIGKPLTPSNAYLWKAEILAFVHQGQDIVKYLDNK